MWARLAAWSVHLERRRALCVVALLALLLSLTAVGRYLVLDDFVLGLAARGSPVIPGFEQHSFNLFTFTTGRPSDNLELMNQGFLLPWWTDPELQIAFFRPLSSLTHRIDFALWPRSSVLMYVHSLAWFALLLAAVAALYRAFESSAKSAGVAFALYALDDAHGPALAWVSNRNALIATALGVVTLILHDRARRGGRNWAAWLAPLVLFTGLMAGEFALGALAYLFAYAVYLDPAPLRRRARSLLPYLAVAAVWRVIYQALGYGSRGSGAYVDPAHAPLDFLRVLPEKLAVLLAGALGVPPSDLAFLAPPAELPLLLAITAITLLAASFLFARLLREDRSARFWALGAFLAAVPIAASFPSDRLLFFVGLGVMALFARAFDRLVAERIRGERWTLRALTAGAFLALHALAAPLALPSRAGQMQVLGRALAIADESLPAGPDLPQRTLVVVLAPVDIFASYIQAERAFEQRVRPKAVHWLASASSDATITRSGPRELTLELAEGYLRTPLERHYRGALGSLPAGSSVRLSDMQARVLTTTRDGRPLRVAFTFDAPLEDGQFSFVRWDKNRYVPFALPDVGKSLTLARADLGAILLDAALNRRR